MSLEPFKIVGQLIACEKDANNDIVGERVVAEMVLYAPHFGELDQRVRDAWPDILAAAGAAAAGGPGPASVVARPGAAGGGPGAAGIVARPG